MRRASGIMQLPPIGLREAVLRVSCEERADHRRERSKSRYLTFARAMARLETATLDQWVFLQRTCGVPEDRIGAIR
jgi:hypothetical protein